MTSRTRNVSLTRDELIMVIAALYATSPSGGGSKPFSLARRIADAAGIDLGSDEIAEAVLKRAEVVVREHAEGS